MKTSFFTKIAIIGFIINFAVMTTGFVFLLTPQTAEAQGIVDFVISGSPVLDGCDGIGSSKYQAIAAELGIDLEGGIQGGIDAAWNELGNPDVGGAILGGLKDLGGLLADTGIGEAIGGALEGLGGILGNIAIPGLGGAAGNILGGVIGGLFGGDGPDEVVERGLRQLEERGQKILLYEQQKMTEKERCLDSLAQEAGQKALRELTDWSVDWVQTGFERGAQGGNSAFVQDLDQHQNSVADDEYSQYVAAATSNDGDGGSFSGTCNFIRRPVMDSIDAEYNSSIGNSGRSGGDDFPDGTHIPTPSSEDCILTERGVSEEQAKAFTSGYFTAGGGWSGLAITASNPGTSPVSARIQQQQELDSRVNQAQEQEREELRWGRGFVADDNQNGFTPGSIVQGITERIFTSDVSRLELIDEMGEVAGDLGKTLISKITGGGDGGGGLSEVDGSETIGGEAGSGYEYLARQLREDIANQLEIEREVESVLSDIVPLYQSEELEIFRDEIRSCVTAGNIDDSNGLLSKINNNVDQFQSSILQIRVRIDWNGNSFDWQPVIKEEQRQRVGWNGSDYDWENDGVERYYNQGTAERCENTDDINNISYVVRQEVIAETEDDFRGLFDHLEPDFAGAQIFDFLRDDSDGNIDSVDETFIDDKHYDFGLPNGGVYTVWEKQICKDSSIGLTVDWHERWDPPSEDDFANSSEGERRFQNTRCELVSNYQYCLSPAYRAPTIVSGQIYKEDRDGVIEASRCSAREDAGTHYFVNGNDETWSTRECVTRQSPQGAPVEWESGFPDSAEQTNIPAYADETTTSPREDQTELVQELENLQEELSADNEERDVLAAQQTYESLRDRFNTDRTAGVLQDQAERLVRDVRELNQIAMDSESTCGAGSEDLESFGDAFLENMENQQPPTIDLFEAARVQGGNGENFIDINWVANADSCQAQSSPTFSGWNGEVSTGTGSAQIETPNNVDLSLVCERGWETTHSNQFIFSVQNFSNERTDINRSVQGSELDVQ